MLSVRLRKRWPCPAETHESSKTFLQVAFDDREPARRIAPCKKKTANGPNTLLNLQCFRTGRPYRSSASTQTLAVEPSAITSRHIFKVCSSAKVCGLTRDISFLRFITGMSPDGTQSSKTGNSIGVMNRQDMGDCSCSKTPPFTKSRGS